ncbi:AraC family transcriptional regulator [Paenibacillus darwinianus]|uniref:AraC family transcriptional regulator n=1 Tax=Paenibacillus darwinianus TaxID=1380763 RepID=A0A9W5S2A1_9BACL|nr:AraC family transcriptional regulator [Paenibacillus darwinianus]EXX90243.1 AraC family transcriptional regulator [Paenibacillus darwinianus]EXX90906.1 AraC family transcriptional regulator [Paenibacillus darwinianus]EXX90937.1 AraC family transcriptional regulator [Paenibacillus darwinianus]
MKDNSRRNGYEGKPARTPFPYARMERRKEALDRLDLRFRWGNYGIHVLHCHLVRFPGDSTIPFHRHSEFEFHFIPQGKGKVVLEEREFELGEGMFYLTGPGVLHQQWSDPADPMAELCLHCEIVPLADAAAPEGWGGDIEAREAAEIVRILRESPPAPVADRFNAMAGFLNAYRVWEEQTVGFYTSIRQEVIHILCSAARALAPDEEAGAIPERDMSVHRFQLAKQYIDDNASRPITLEEVASAVGVGARQLQRVFRREGGTTFHARLEKTRLERICYELAYGTRPVEDIALRNGYANPNYLYPVFKQRFGMTPAAYRNTYDKTLEWNSSRGEDRVEQD